MPFIGTLEDNGIKTPHGILDGFPILELWRFFIDGDKQIYSWQDYEIREPGYTTHMTQAYLEMLDGDNSPPTLERLKTLQRQATDNVMGMIDTKAERQDPSSDGFRKRGVESSFKLSWFHNLSTDGHTELLGSTGPFGHKLTKRISNNKLGLWFVAPMNNVQIKAESTLEFYRSTCKKEDRTVDEIIKSLILLISTLDRLHLFSDGNIRTFAILLLHRESLRFGLIPPIFNNPNIFDGFSQKEIFEEFKVGQERTLFLIARHTNPTLEVPEHLHYAYTYSEQKGSQETVSQPALAGNPILPMHDSQTLSDLSDVKKLDRMSIRQDMFSPRQGSYFANTSSPLLYDLDEQISFRMVLCDAFIGQMADGTKNKVHQTLESLPAELLIHYLSCAISSHLTNFISSICTYLKTQILETTDRNLHLKHDKTLQFIAEYPFVYFKEIKMQDPSIMAYYELIIMDITKFRELHAPSPEQLKLTL